MSQRPHRENATGYKFREVHPRSIHQNIAKRSKQKSWPPLRSAEVRRKPMNCKNRVGVPTSAGMLIAILAAIVLSYGPRAAAQAYKIPPAITTPDKVDTKIGKLEFKDGAPSAATVQKAGKGVAGIDQSAGSDFGDYLSLFNLGEDAVQTGDSSIQSLAPVPIASAPSQVFHELLEDSKSPGGPDAGPPLPNPPKPSDQGLHVS